MGLANIPTIQEVQTFINNNNVFLWLFSAFGIITVYAIATTLAMITIMVKKKKKTERYNEWKANHKDTFNFGVFKREFSPPNTDEFVEQLWAENQRLEKEVAECRNEVNRLTSDNSFFKVFARFALVFGIVKGLYHVEDKDEKKSKPPDNLPQK